MIQFTVLSAVFLAHVLLRAAALGPNVRFRNGNRSDELMIAATMLQNPFEVSGERFVVAVDENERRLGWVQLRPLGTSRVDPNQYSARPGSYNVEDAVDDYMWEALENEDIIVPNGFSSLPWTPEYRAFAEAAKKRREKRQKILQAEERLSQQLGIWELASLHVDSKYRGQGIGTELVQRIMRRHVLQDREASNVYLLSPVSNRGWFRNVLGFEQVPEQEAPARLSLKMNAAVIVSKFAGANEKVCCMRGVDVRDKET